MATSSWNAGIIRPVPVAPTGPYEDGAAPGVWTIDQATFWIQQGLWPLAGNPAPVGLFAGGGGAGGSYLGQIGKISIPNTGNAVSWGSLAQDTKFMGACASTTTALWGAGYATGAVNVSSIYYTTISTSGTATFFGALNNGGNNIQELAGCSSSTRGLFGGGYDTGANYVCLISYVTIATTGNATNFGNLTQGRRQLGATSSSTRGIFVGGIINSTDETNVMDYVTIASTGNATSFGILTNRLSYISGCASSTRGLFAGGLDFNGNFVNTIQYVTIATTGNAASFGSLTSTCYGTYSCSSQTRGVTALGYTTNNSSALNYVTIATTGNAVSFGNLTVVAFYGGAASNSHGGI